MARSLRVLFCEDSEDDLELMRLEIESHGYDVRSGRVQASDTLREALRNEAWDVVISDYVMPGFRAPDALRVLHESGIDLPFIIVSGTIEEELAVDCLRAGAHDFLNKDRLARLVPAIQREMREVLVRRERRQAEQALRESERKYRVIVETTHEGICVLDSADRITFVNRRLGEMLGMTSDEIVGASLIDFVDEETRPRLARADDVGRYGSTKRFEARITRRDEREFWASIAVTPISDDAHAHAGAVVLITDVSDQRSLQAQLMASDRMVTVGTLAAGVAHEINNPLSAVLANLEDALLEIEQLRKELGASKQIEELHAELRDSVDAAGRVRDIVRDLKLLSRAEEEKRQEVDVRRVLDSCARMAKNEIRHRASLVKEYQDVALIEANESRIGQVFLNLIVNAAQALPEGHANENEIRLVAKMNGDDRVVVEVHDTGAGIPGPVMKRLFTPFFTTKAAGVGTGLGLSICHRLISSLGGEITVESEVGRGTVFRVALPAARPSSQGPTEVRREATAPARRGSVLVVDDDAMVGVAIRRSLESQHDVITTTSATEALVMLRAGNRFDVILCDLMMPEMTGMDLHRECRLIAPDQATRMLFLTGGAFTPRAREFFDSTENPRMDKPFDPKVLREAVAGLIGRVDAALR
jgi:PAS domain S-box-containing protein